MKFARNGSNSHMVDLLFTLALFCVFAASALMVVLIGARVYQNTIERMNSNFDGRASITYVTNKIRQSDSAGMIDVITMKDGVTAIVLDREFDGDIYSTLIYHYNGALREVFVEKGANFNLDSGQEIVRVSQFNVRETSENLFSLETVDLHGNTVHAMVAAHCGA